MIFHVFALSLLIQNSFEASIENLKPTFPDNYPFIPFEHYGFPGWINRIIKGQNAVSGQFPHQALLIGYKSGSNYFCGGSLIDKDLILTAAHCVKGMNSMVIALGTINSWKTSGSEIYSTYITPANAFVHPNYDERQIKSDIALLRLPQSVQFTDYIKPIRIAGPNNANQDAFSSARAIISGWGKTSDAQASVNSKLQYASVDVLSQMQCRIFYQQIRVNIDNKQICTKFSGSGTCNGDSGGPLTVNNNGETTLIGITSFGLSKCEAGGPSVFTCVACHYDWIVQTAGRNL